MISIITATYNAERTICDNLLSLSNQTATFDQIIVDGCSTDKTLTLLEQKQSYHNTLVSEPDLGIYDAMNKGIVRAGGDIIGILNADDFYAHSKVLEKVNNVFNDQRIQACYGDLVYVKENVNQPDRFTTVRYWKSGCFTPQSFYWGWMPPHPTFFVRKSVYEKHGLFNLNLGSAADYEIMLRFLLKHRIKCMYIPEVLVHMRIGGVSNAKLLNRLAANKNDRKAWAVNALKPYPWTLILKPLRKLGQWVSTPSSDV